VDPSALGLSKFCAQPTRPEAHMQDFPTTPGVRQILQNPFSLQWMMYCVCRNHPPVRSCNLLIHRRAARVELTQERWGVMLSIWKEPIPDETKPKRDEVTSLTVIFKQRSKALRRRKNQVVKLLATFHSPHAR